MRHIRLDKLEQRAALLNDKSLFTVEFSNGERRVMPLCDVIGLLCDSEQPHVVDVRGKEREGDGHLLQLIKGIMNDII